MTKLEAIAAIAEGVMGVRVFDEPVGIPATKTYWKKDGKILRWSVDLGRDVEWSPDTSPGDAIEILEKWCKEHKAYYKIIGHPGVTYEVLLMQNCVELYSSDGNTMTWAAFLAVCAVEGIKVDNAKTP